MGGEMGGRKQKCYVKTRTRWILLDYIPSPWTGIWHPKKIDFPKIKINSSILNFHFFKQLNNKIRKESRCCFLCNVFNSPPNKLDFIGDYRKYVLITVIRWAKCRQ